MGPTFRQERFRTINELGIRYVGLDFEHVCAQRRADLFRAGIADRNITFLGNASGTYLFNLIRLARNRETFDIIYLDGSHSIYVDLAATIAAVRAVEAWRSVPFRRCEVFLRKETCDPDHNSICGCE